MDPAAMHRIPILLAITVLAATGITGCQWVEALTAHKVDDPVFGPPPPRMALANNGSPQNAATGDKVALASTTAGAPGGVVPISTTAGGNIDTSAPLQDTDVVATVNGAPIFVSEVLDRYGVQLAAARKEAPADQIEELRRSLLKRDLKNHIERKVLVETLRSTLKPEQIQLLEDHLKGLFEQETDRLKKQLNVNTTHELEIELRKQKTSLANLRDGFYTQRMSMEYLAVKSRKKQALGRPELYAYYEQHIDEYLLPARVLWQQIVINFSEHGGKRESFAVLNQVIEELKQGDDFGAVAKRHSNGPTAQKGGQWDWTQKGSVANEEIERALFMLEVGAISQVFVDESSFRLVKINDRQEAGRVPFEDLQDEIKQKLQEETRKEAARDVLQELLDSAVVTTIFDEEEAAAKQEEVALPFQ